MVANLTLISTFLFLALCLFAGLYSSKGKQTFRSFAVGDKNFSVFGLVATIVATVFGGSFLLRDLREIYLNGLYYGLCSLCSFSGCLVISRFLALRMGEFLGDCSIAESMGRLFGPIVQKVTALFGILNCACILAIQLTVIEKIIKMYCQVNGPIASYCAIAIVLLYSVFGGMQAVAFTDMIQFIIFAALLPSLIYLIGFVGKGVRDVKAIVHVLTTHPHFDLRQVVGWTPRFMNTLLLLLSSLLPSFQPAPVQRIYMSKNTKDVRASFLYTFIQQSLVR